MDPNSGTVIIGAVFGCLSVSSAFMFWMMCRFENRFHSDITAITERLDRHMSDNRAEWNAANERIDQTGDRIDKNLTMLSTRIDQTQAIIMRILEKKGM